MLSFEPNIVVIDDKPEEIKGIIDYYRDLGIGCKYFQVGVIGNAQFPENTFSDVSIVFLDLYFSEDLNSYDSELCINWIESIIPEKSFYILVIWSREVEHRDEILSKLKEKHLSPFICIVHNKSDFISQHQEIERYNFTGLIQEISMALDQTPTLAEMGIWKKNIKRTANKVIGGLTKDQNPDIFKIKLKKIIFGHGGTAIIKSNDVLRKRSVLFDALDKVLISNISADNVNCPISEINQNLLYKISPSELKGNTDNELNSWFHFKFEKVVAPDFILPGLISRFNNSFLQKKFTIKDDSKLEPKLSKQTTENGVLIEDVIVVLARPCDIAQVKYGKNIKLLSGLKIIRPYRYKEDNLSEHQRKNKKQYLNKIVFTSDLPDSCKLYDNLFFSEDENDVALLFDFRYIFSVPEQVFKDKFINTNVFNKELLSEIQIEYCNYSSRLGITQID